MKTQLLTLAILATALLAAPIAQAAPGGSVCNSDDPSGKSLVVYWCGPGEATIGSTFFVSVDARETLGGTNQITYGTPTLYGCTLLSTTTQTASDQVVKLYTVRMDAATCSLAVVVSAGNPVAPTAWSTPIVSVYDPTATLPTTFTQNINGALDLTGTLNNNINGSITLDGGITVNITDIPNLDLYIQQWPTLFAQTQVEDWPALVAAIEGLSIDVVIERAFENATVETFPDANEIELTIALYWPLILAFIALAMGRRSGTPAGAVLMYFVSVLAFATAVLTTPVPEMQWFIASLAFIPLLHIYQERNLVMDTLRN